ncbi:MAG: Glycosyl transferase group 1 [Candidatus Yanofskybacteria bacterium GW2011_GWD2_39_48]|uniref:Glycosyl transferase group 1 n=1 Tax=Candidatus Yanofskybacteria bacterium GW2011_GWD2_39_48 TaxID=1619031 RepID=A0A0G0P7D8_9BACT|nr:MAG: Glycosyl transferase group 1 [Candidatus Yanofskybacteria bacterium GW2011_GWD2_39_48]
MTIGVDIRLLASKYKSGIEEYLENLLSNMIPLDPKIEYKLFYNSFRKPLPEYNWLKLSNVTVFDLRIPNNLLFLSGRLFNRPYIDKLLGGVDVFFSPHFFIAPLSKKCRRVTAIHDLSFSLFPNFFSSRHRFWHKFEMTPARQARYSDKIIAVSESTKQDLTRYYDIDPAKVQVIYSGVSEKITRQTDRDLEIFRLSKKLPERFILFLGKLEPRKNVSAIIRAFNRIKLDKSFHDLHLVIAGARGWLCDELDDVARQSPFTNQIIFADQINDYDRSFYYGLASVFIYPSFFEGFGFPPVESMACGTAVITSNRSSLGEVVSDAGIIIEPNNIMETAFWLKKLLSDQGLRDRFIKKGYGQAASFNWSETAKKTLDLIINA